MVVKIKKYLSSNLYALTCKAIKGICPLNKPITFKNLLVISSATITAQCSYCGYLLRSKSQYSIVRIIWL